jgi:hypothetical protein
MPFHHQTVLSQRKRKFGDDMPSGSAPPVPGPGSRPKSFIAARKFRIRHVYITPPGFNCFPFNDLRIRIPIRYRILCRAYIVKSVFGKTITWPALSRPLRSAPPVDVDHELGEDLRGRVVQPEPAPDRCEVGDGIHHLQHPARGLPIFAEGLKSKLILILI